MTDRVGAEDRLDAAAAATLGALAARPGVVRVALALVEGAGRRLRFTSDDRLVAGVPSWCLVDAYDDVPLTSVVRTGEAVLAAVDALDSRYAGFAQRQRESGVAAVAVLPMLAGPGAPGSEPAGGLVVYYAEAQDFAADQVADLTAAAREAALALADRRPPRPTTGRHAVAAGARVASTVVDGDPRAARTARQFLRRELASWQVEEQVAEVAVLCASELVTNAVMHTGAASEVRVSLDDATLTLVVRDHGGPGSAVPVPESDHDPLRVHGRGLQLVEALAQRWGTEREAGGTTVWVELDRRAAG